MTPRQIQLVQETFTLIVPLADTAAALFYRRMFTLDPSLQGLFHHDMEHQGNLFVAAIAFVVRNVEEPEHFVPAMQELGRRHAGYQVKANHYRTALQALIETLSETLGERFTAEIEDAWCAAFATMVEAMVEGTRQAEAAATPTSAP